LVTFSFKSALTFEGDGLHFTIEMWNQSNQFVAPKVAIGKFDSESVASDRMCSKIFTSSY
jgi:hypothetical protein